MNMNEPHGADASRSTARVDLHCHSTASELSKRAHSAIALAVRALSPSAAADVYARRLTREQGADLLADAFLFASETDTFGQVILEAQASGLAVLAVDAEALAAALAGLAGRPSMRAQLGAAGVEAARGRSWERALGQLADGYVRALGSSREAAVAA
jgi:hypothetical protein